MKRICLFVLVGLFQINLWAKQELEHDLSSEIWGHWKYLGYIYQGYFQDSPNPDLVMTFEFYQDGTDLLHWYRIGQRGFCERRGRYQFDGETLIDEVFWVNPKNARDCSADPDMRLGQKTTTAMTRDRDKIYMELPLSDEVVIYVWERKEPLQSQAHKNSSRRRVNPQGATAVLH